MDKQGMQLLERALRQLGALGLKPVAGGRQKPDKAGLQHDARIRLGRAGAHEWRLVEVKRAVTPATLGAVQARLKAFDGRPLLVTEYLTPPVADRLHDMDIEFVDAAGNAYIRLKNTLIWVAGRRRAATEQGNWPTGRAFEPGGLRVLFALLCNPEFIGLAYRELASKTGVAHGTVGWVFGDLAARGFLVGQGERRMRRELVRTRQLAQQWVEAYARTLRPTLLLGRYRMTEGAKPTGALQLMPGMQLGGEIAAARITGYLKPATATVWADRIDPKFIVTNRLALDPAGNVEVMRKFWNFETDTLNQVPDLLTYADLLAMGDARTIETARLMEGKVLDRFVG